MAMEQATVGERVRYGITEKGYAFLEEWRQRRRDPEAEAETRVRLTPSGRRALRRLRAEGKLDQ